MTDGTKRSVIEHNLHILLLPGLHTPAAAAGASAPKRHGHGHGHVGSPSSSSLELAVHQQQQQQSNVSVLHALAHPVLSIAGLSVPSPFHLQLRIISKLTFNEQGRISAHRDFWDARDLVGLIPGATAAQWVLTRLAARGLATANWFFKSRSSRYNVDGEYQQQERGRVTVEEHLDALGLLGVGRKERRAPDTDLDSVSIMNP